MDCDAYFHLHEFQICSMQFQNKIALVGYDNNSMFACLHTSDCVTEGVRVYVPEHDLLRGCSLCGDRSLNETLNGPIGM